MFRFIRCARVPTARFARPQVGLRFKSSIPRTDIESRVLSVFKNYLQSNSNLTNTSSFQELGLDSLDAVELIVAVEEEFGIEIPDKESDEIRSVKDTVDYLEAQDKAR